MSGATALDRLLEELGISIDPQLLQLALTHRSYAYENGGLPTNERLEFLGDSVLGVVVTEHLYVQHPDLSEGQLAKLRAAVVNARALADVARSLEVGPLIRLGRGELNSGGADKSSILADTMEALIGAVFLSCGQQGAAVFIHHLFDPLTAAAAQLGAGLDWKTSVQEMVASQGLGLPVYEVSESGPDHAKQFEAWLVVDGESFGPGTGRNKKQAEQEAAAAAFRAMESRVAGVAAAAAALQEDAAAEDAPGERPGEDERPGDPVGPASV
ncbi:ribonuclease III [Auraticoccus cholistanensis]|uniref:ribonuclease III n=1 Tax=Auraticoccus cholistanensis TaxID=2656650 RepID=UPI001E433D0E|nr:ribonuclease III [Auraticoccus cholistanensis]